MYRAVAQGISKGTFAQEMMWIVVKMPEYVGIVNKCIK